MLPITQDSMQELGIGLSIVLAQSIQEIGYTTIVKATNYLGIKSHGIAYGPTPVTNEDLDGSMVKEGQVS